MNHPPTKQDFAKFMFNIPLDFVPGTDSKYSNIGYLLLGMVVEKASRQSYFDCLNNNILVPAGISNVFVGHTRLAGRRDNEVTYEDPLTGPDATMSPFSPATAPLPYGGFGTMTEVMDSAGGLITSAKSLSQFISQHNVWVNDITDDPGRNGGETTRSGSLPGTAAIARSGLDYERGENDP